MFTPANSSFTVKSGIEGYELHEHVGIEARNLGDLTDMYFFLRI